ncbi:11623_t:CDS:1, partial [Entrophospora sp. SA101]
ATTDKQVPNNTSAPPPQENANGDPSHQKEKLPVLSRSQRAGLQVTWKKTLITLLGRDFL